MLFADPASHCSLIYASSTHICLVRCEISSEWPRKGHPQCHRLPGYLTTMIFFNDPRYGSHLAGDQVQLFILQILIEEVSEGQLIGGRTEVIYHGDQQLFKSWNRDVSCLSLSENVRSRVIPKYFWWSTWVISELSNWIVSFLLASCVPKWNTQTSVFDGFGRKRHWWKNLLRVSRPSSRSRWISHSSNFLAWCVSVISSVALFSEEHLKEAIWQHIVY
jgi:hypothetical protein